MTALKITHLNSDKISHSKVCVEKKTITESALPRMLTDVIGLACMVTLGTVFAMASSSIRSATGTCYGLSAEKIIKIDVFCLKIAIMTRSFSLDI